MLIPVDAGAYGTVLTPRWMREKSEQNEEELSGGSLSKEHDEVIARQTGACSKPLVASEPPSIPVRFKVSDRPT